MHDQLNDYFDKISDPSLFSQFFFKYEVLQFKYTSYKRASCSSSCKTEGIGNNIFSTST